MTASPHTLLAKASHMTDPEAGVTALKPCITFEYKMTSKAHILNAWSPAEGGLLGDGSTLERQGLVGDSRPLGVSPNAVLGPQFSSLSASCLSRRKGHATRSCCCDVEGRGLSPLRL